MGVGGEQTNKNNKTVIKNHWQSLIYLYSKSSQFHAAHGIFMLMPF